LRETLDALDIERGTSGNRLFYLATPGGVRAGAIVFTAVLMLAAAFVAWGRFGPYSV
jgi:hypothetical protein